MIAALIMVYKRANKGLATHQVYYESLQVSECLIHIILGSTQGDDVTLPDRFGEYDLNLVEFVSDLADLTALLSNQSPVKTLFDDDISRFLIFLQA